MSPKPFKLGDRCRRGHLLTKDNTYTEGSRLRCKDCRELWKTSTRVTKDQLTHCPKKHEYTDTNTYVDPRGYKHCKTCRRDRMRERREPGIGQGGANKVKTHCPQHHEYTSDNTWTDKKGSRHCRICARANGEVQNLKRYSLTLEKFTQMLIAQSGRCGICNDPMYLPNIDHDHSCCPHNISCGKCIRELLCTDCNHGLGKFKDSISRGEAMVDYLKRHASKD